MAAPTYRSGSTRDGAVLESWGFAAAMCDAVASQRDYERRWQHDPGLTDVLIVSIALADAPG